MCYSWCSLSGVECKELVQELRVLRSKVHCTATCHCLQLRSQRLTILQLQTRPALGSLFSLIVGHSMAMDHGRVQRHLQSQTAASAAASMDSSSTPLSRASSEPQQGAHVHVHGVHYHSWRQSVQRSWDDGHVLVCAQLLVRLDTKLVSAARQTWSGQAASSSRAEAVHLSSSRAMHTCRQQGFHDVSLVVCRADVLVVGRVPVHEERKHNRHHHQAKAQHHGRACAQSSVSAGSPVPPAYRQQTACRQGLLSRHAL